MLLTSELYRKVCVYLPGIFVYDVSCGRGEFKMIRVVYQEHIELLKLK
jgi:hypothetical protein